MNLSPSRHPAFIAVACLSLLAAWSTPEADVGADVTSDATLVLGEAMPPTVRAPASLEADCIAHAGAQRALCVYTATRQGASPSVTVKTARVENSKVSPKPVRVATQNRNTAASVSSKTSFFE